ncbi:MAG: MBL fold metallo-hydrolase [Pseudomonadota bacterium]
MSELIVGKPVRLSATVVRVLAPNPSVFTGPGTNSYLIARGNDIVVLDPGPADENHLAALLAAADTLGGTIRDIVCTHTHEDHSPGTSRAFVLVFSPPAMAVRGSLQWHAEAGTPRTHRPVAR